MVFLFTRFLFFSIFIWTPNYSNVSFIPYFAFLVFGILVTIVAWFSFRFFCLAHLALQNVNKDYIIFSYFRNFVAKNDQNPKTKNGRNKTQVNRTGWKEMIGLTWKMKKNKTLLISYLYSTVFTRTYIDYLWEILEGHANDVVNHPVDMM